MGFRSSRAFITFVVSYAIFTDQFIFTSIIPFARDMVQRRFHIPADEVTRKSANMLTTCGVAMLVASPILGWWADRSTTRRPLFLIGLFMITEATVLLWMTPYIHLAYLARILQGIGSAIVWVMSLAIMFDTVGHSRIGEFMGYVGIGMNLGTILGPKSGAMAYERWGEDGVFIMCLSLILGDILLRVVMKEKDAPAQDLYIAAIRRRSTSATDTTATEKNPSKRKAVATRAKLLPSTVTLLYRPRFVCTLWGVFIMAAVGDAFKVALPLHADQVFQFKPNQIADAYIILATPTFLGPLFGRLSDRIGPRWVAMVGMLLLGVFQVLLRVVADAGDKAVLWILLFLVGLATTIALEPLTAEIAHVVAKEDATREHGVKFNRGSYGQGYGLFNTAWSAGNTFGPLWATHMYEAKGWNMLWLALGLITIATGLPVFLMCGGWWFTKRRKTA